MIQVVVIGEEPRGADHGHRVDHGVGGAVPRHPRALQAGRTQPRSDTQGTVQGFISPWKVNFPFLIRFLGPAFSQPDSDTLEHFMCFVWILR